MSGCRHLDTSDDEEIISELRRSNRKRKNHSRTLQSFDNGEDEVVPKKRGKNK